MFRYKGIVQLAMNTTWQGSAKTNSNKQLPISFLIRGLYNWWYISFVPKFSIMFRNFVQCYLSLLLFHYVCTPV